MSEGRRRDGRGRVRSREWMHDLRSRPPEFDVCPAGPTGGQYKPLSTQDVRSIYDSAIQILEEIGMSQCPARLVDQACEKGARINDMGRLCYPHSMIEDIIDQSCKTFVLHGRDSQHDIEVGGDTVYFGTGGAAVQTLDPQTGNYRPSTLRDLYDFARLADSLKNVSWFTRCCVATDVADPFDLDVNTAYAMLRGTRKPIGTSFFVGRHVAPVVEMFDLALGGAGYFRKRPFCKVHISPVISPLRYGEDAFEVALEAIKYGMPINAIIAAQSGATSPATLAGMLATTLAETLAALVMVNVFSPGYPMIFSNWPFVIDLRTGSFAGGGGEIALLNAASAQLTNHLGLPSGVAACMADSKVPDAQMGFEKALSALSTGLSGANMIYESSGMMASLLGVSFESFVIDDEMLSHVYRMIRGIEVNQETLGFEAIMNAVTGEGHFLGGGHTLGAMQKEYFYPKLADRESPEVWKLSGSLNIQQKARLRVEEILQQPTPDYLSSPADQKIRDRFRVLLDV